mgnify:CR=1 FL=1
MDCAEIPCKLSYLRAINNKKIEIEKNVWKILKKEWKIMQKSTKEVSLHRQRKRLENDGK